MTRLTFLKSLAGAFLAVQLAVKLGSLKVVWRYLDGGVESVLVKPWCSDTLEGLRARIAAANRFRPVGPERIIKLHGNRQLWARDMGLELEPVECSGCGSKVIGKVSRIDAAYLQPLMVAQCECCGLESWGPSGSTARAGLSGANREGRPNDTWAGGPMADLSKQLGSLEV